jgi:CHASE3 domain sensor protein
MTRTKAKLTSSFLIQTRKKQPNRRRRRSKAAIKAIESQRGTKKTQQLPNHLATIRQAHLLPI